MIEGVGLVNTGQLWVSSASGGSSVMSRVKDRGRLCSIMFVPSLLCEHLFLLCINLCSKQKILYSCFGLFQVFPCLHTFETPNENSVDENDPWRGNECILAFLSFL